ncbi:hypothetical protein, partial [Erwinia sp. V71]|uniref:hypothetical protein n=1 Tax=Erwinia sp. V71 TaxID=3369424 RepID=UPI003F60661B
QATVCGVCRAKIGGLALHFGVESAVFFIRITYRLTGNSRTFWTGLQNKKNLTSVRSGCHLANTREN